MHCNRLKPYYGCPKEVETNLTEEEPKSQEKNGTQDHAGYTWVECEDDVNHGGEEIERDLVENEPMTQGPVEQLLEANIPLPTDQVNDTAKLQEVPVSQPSTARTIPRLHSLLTSCEDTRHLWRG